MTVTEESQQKDNILSPSADVASKEALPSAGGVASEVSPGDGALSPPDTKVENNDVKGGGEGDEDVGFGPPPAIERAHLFVEGRGRDDDCDEYKHVNVVNDSIEASNTKWGLLCCTKRTMGQIIIAIVTIVTMIMYFHTPLNEVQVSAEKKTSPYSHLHEIHKTGNDVVGFFHNNVTFGHIHYAKTGGTTINGLLALNYERVCGHKGYSYDYYRQNTRLDNRTKWKTVDDLYSQVKPGYTRGRVPPNIMDEIGYEDCDWISFEQDASRWKRFRNWHQPLELHLPCREPIDHLMSQCNFRSLAFNCNSSDLDLEIKKCLVIPNRFRFGLVDGTIIPEGSVKCYDFHVQFTKYLRLMEDVLQAKKITADYVQRDTNSNRNKTNECIWKNERVKAYTTDFLTNEVPYYSYCDSCIGSNMDLFAV